MKEEGPLTYHMQTRITSAVAAISLQMHRLETEIGFSYTNLFLEIPCFTRASL